jgi:crotonobetainyl-CoA:carnitine CoA-transferase CaiB-like acyl-CoA transferase
MSWVSRDGHSRADRPSLDALHFGWNALYRLYKTAHGWLCVAALTQSHWTHLCDAIDRKDLAADVRFVSHEARRANDPALAAELETLFGTRAAKEWVKLLDTHNVPAEVSSSDFVLNLFDDPEMIEKGWVTSYTHEKVGRMDAFGKLIDFSNTPATVQGAAPLVGAHTREILKEAGYLPSEIEAMLAANIVGEPSRPERPLAARGSTRA